MSDEAAADLVKTVRWYHSFALRPGLVTPGASGFEGVSACSALSIPADLSGKRCLDVGAWDGPLTFEMERRGAEVIALDIQDPKRVGFDVARCVLGSKAVHYQGSVYQLPFDKMSELDLIAFRGVYYHLKYPLLAFECLCAALKVGGTLHFEGEGLLHYVENLKGETVQIPVALLDELAAKGVPLCLSYPNSYKKSSNWFIPNAPCLESWLVAAGFEVGAIQAYSSGGAQRFLGWAKKTSDRSSLIEHPFY